jgi:hypothetical protein
MDNLLLNRMITPVEDAACGEAGSGAKVRNQKSEIRGPQLNSLRLSSSKNLTGQAEIGRSEGEKVRKKTNLLIFLLS